MLWLLRLAWPESAPSFEHVVGLAWLSWRFVELPFRDKRLLAGRKPVLVGGLMAMAVLAVTGSVVRSQEGFPQRLSGKALEYAQAREWRAGQMKCMLVSMATSICSSVMGWHFITLLGLR